MGYRNDADWRCDFKGGVRMDLDKRTLMMVVMIAGTAVSATALILSIMGMTKHTGMICGAVGGAVGAVVVTFSKRNRPKGD